MRFQSNVPDKIKNKKRPTWREINRRPLLYILYYALLSRDLTEFHSALVKKKQGQNSKILSLPSPHTAAHTEASTTLTPHQIFRTFTQREKRLVLKKTNSFSHFFFFFFFSFLNLWDRGEWNFADFHCSIKHRSVFSFPFSLLYSTRKASSSLSFLFSFQICTSKLRLWIYVYF